MTSIVIDAADFTPEQVKQILQFIERTKMAGLDVSPVPKAKCVGRDGNVEPEIAAKLFGAEPSVGNEPMKETRFTD